MRRHGEASKQNKEPGERSKAKLVANGTKEFEDFVRSSTVELLQSGLGIEEIQKLFRSSIKVAWKELRKRKKTRKA